MAKAILSGSFVEIDIREACLHTDLIMAIMDGVSRLDAGGRLVIPSAIRKAIGLKVGDEVVLVVDGQDLRLLTSAQAIVRAQALVRKHVAAGRRLSDELVRERRP